MSKQVNAVRPLVLGRKNYLFAGSDSGGVRAAKMYTLIETKFNGLDPEAYLRDIIARIADHRINRIDELLAWTWKAVADKLATRAPHVPRVDLHLSSPRQ